jgi:hypothetical protein
MGWGQGPWGSGTFGTSAEFNVTDQEILSLVQLMLLEADTQGQTWQSNLWSLSEVVNYINDRTRRFLKETGLTQEIQFIDTLALQNTYDIPPDTIDIRRLAWRSGPQGFEYTELARVDSWELDNMVDSWTIGEDDAPSVYTDSFLPTLQVLVAPIPTDVGSGEITTVALGPEVDGSGLKVGVPDEYVPAIVWGVLSDCLQKQGEGNDPERAAYCESRYQEGIVLGNILLNGS